jgi:hypothetical protein
MEAAHVLRVRVEHLLVIGRIARKVASIAISSDPQQSIAIHSNQ